MIPRPRHLLVLAALLLPVIVHAQTPPPEKPDPRTFRLLVEPRYQNAPVWEPLPGAKETGIAAGTIDQSGVPRQLRPEELKFAQTDFATFKRDALQHIDKLFAEIKPRRVLSKDGKSSNHTIYHSKNPLTASLLLCPKLLDRHRQEYGDTLLAVVPDRFTLVVLPADAEILEARSNLLTGIFDNSVYPISLEVFQISATGIRAIGHLSTR